MITKVVNLELCSTTVTSSPEMSRKQVTSNLFIYLFIFNLFNVDKLTYIFDIWK